MAQGGFKATLPGGPGGPPGHIDLIACRPARAAPNARSSVMAGVLCALLIPACLITASGCAQPSSVVVVYVVPRGYHGGFVIRFNQRRGVLAAKDEHGRWIFRIPPSGVLKIQGDGPWAEWHRVEARYSDGQPIAVVNEASTFPENRIGFWFNLDEGGLPRHTYQYFIGTKAEARRFGGFET
jgi:hypothetical protein